MSFSFWEIFSLQIETWLLFSFHIDWLWDQMTRAYLNILLDANCISTSIKNWRHASKKLQHHDCKISPNHLWFSKCVDCRNFFGTNWEQVFFKSSAISQLIHFGIVFNHSKMHFFNFSASQCHNHDFLKHY